MGLNVDVSGTDPEGDPLSYTATGLPPGACFNQTNWDGTPGTCLARNLVWPISYTQAGSSYTISLTASDGSLSATTSLAITVRNLLLAIPFSTFTDSPDPFSPGLGQTTTVSATFNQPVTIWQLRITNSAGADVRKINYTGAPVTTLTQIWNGRNDASSLVAPGTYTYTITATAAPGSNGGTATRSGTVTVQ